MDKSCIIIVILIPLLGALITAFLSKIPSKIRNTWIVGVAAATFIAAASLIPAIMSGIRVFPGRKFFHGIDLFFIGDGLSVFMAVVASLVGGLIVWYSLGYMKNYKHQTEYYFFVLLFIGSMMGLVFSGNLLLMYIFWEITTICSWRLIGFHRNQHKHLLNADKAFLVTFVGSAFMLIGIEMIGFQTGTLNLIKLQGMNIGLLPALLILAGILAKSAQLPLQTWLPDAGVAPSPVTALLHAAVLVKIGVYVFVRLFYTFNVPPEFLSIVMYVAIITAFVAACAALVENDIKRILAYSTISQIAYILLGFSLKSIIGVTAALFFISVHALGKAGLFLCAGMVEHQTGEKDIRNLGGIAKTMPITACAFFMCALSIIGIPPFGGFFAKLMIIMAVIKGGHLIIGGVAVATAVLTLLYLFRLFNAVFMGEQKHSQVKEESFSMLSVLIVFAGLSLLIGIFASLPLGLIEVATNQIMGVVK